MKPAKLAVVVVFLMSIPSVFAGPPQETGAKRTILTKHDISNFPGHEGVLVQVEFAPGAREPKHTHPGDIFGFVEEGALTLSVEGSPEVTVKAGESFCVPAGKVHWGVNMTNAQTKVLATFVVEKGKPLTSPVQ